jgi:transcriptional regulator with XRE-family HTH domain
MVRYGRSLLVDRAAFAKRLQAAIDRNGLTYEEIARRAREHLPASERLSGVSVWQYAKAKSFPRRMSYIEALGKALGVEPDELLIEREDGFGDNEVAPTKAPQNTHVRLTDLGDGRAALFVNAPVPWPIALKVLEVLKSAL